MSMLNLAILSKLRNPVDPRQMQYRGRQSDSDVRQETSLRGHIVLGEGVAWDKEGAEEVGSGLEGDNEG